MLGVTEEWVIKNIDEEMIEIIYVLNSKGYKTFACCQGHPSENGTWNMYIGFSDYTVFKDTPYINFPRVDTFKIPTPTNKFNGLCLYWMGNNENDRQEQLRQILKWAKLLPNAVINKQKTVYNLFAYNTKGKRLFICSTNDYVKVLLNKAKRKYKNYKFKVEERLV